MITKHWVARVFGSILLVVQLGALSAAPRPDVAASQFDIVGPGGSSAFGSRALVESNGNIVIFDPGFNGNRGAVYLYNGATHALISQLTGSAPGDKVGSGFKEQLNNTTLAISSPNWATGAGAFTWFNTATGVNGAVGPSNSLVGSQAGD